jgi:hypothetical protein
MPVLLARNRGIASWGKKHSTHRRVLLDHTTNTKKSPHANGAPERTTQTIIAVAVATTTTTMEPTNTPDKSIVSTHEPDRRIQPIVACVRPIVADICTTAHRPCIILPTHVTHPTTTTTATTTTTTNTNATATATTTTTTTATPSAAARWWWIQGRGSTEHGRAIVVVDPCTRVERARYPPTTCLWV